MREHCGRWLYIIIVNLVFITTGASLMAVVKKVESKINLFVLSL